MSGSSSVDVPRTFGALLLGASTAFGLSGIVTIQCVVYYKQYPTDSSRKKSVVFASWLLDIAHTAFVFLSIYEYLIQWYGLSERIDSIPWYLAVTVVTTALQTLLVHCFFAEKILRSSQNNWMITAPILILAFLRLGSATITTGNMIRLRHFSAFLDSHFSRSLFTTGLSLSAAIDILITGWLCYFLREVRSRIGGPHSTMMIRMVDTLTLYTLENGALTCFAAIASLICWLTMPHNLIFMGLHFVISKLYANSLLASLNMRNELRHLQGRKGSHRTGQLTSGFQHDEGPESVLRIQNSKSLVGGGDSEYELGGKRDHHGYGRKEPPAEHQAVLVQFRPASPSRWNALQPSVDLSTTQHRGHILPTSSANTRT